MKGKAQISPFVTLNSGMFVIYLQQKGGINPNYLGGTYKKKETVEFRHLGGT